jgi:DNA-directed RNA polymerase sigma subunit (sigma70/sigma32)
MMGSNPVTADCYEEFAEDYTEEGYAPTFAQELIYEPDGECEIGKEELEMIEGLIDIALSVMAPKQREVWHHLLGGQSHTVTEIARILNVKRQVVEELRDSGLRKVRKYFAANY